MFCLYDNIMIDLIAIRIEIDIGGRVQYFSHTELLYTVGLLTRHKYRMVLFTYSEGAGLWAGIHNVLFALVFVAVLSFLSLHPVSCDCTTLLCTQCQHDLNWYSDLWWEIARSQDQTSGYA